MSYTNIFSTYKAVDPPKRIKDFKILQSNNDYDFLDLIIPSAVSKNRTQEPQESQESYDALFIPEPVEHNIEVTLPVSQARQVKPAQNFGSLVNIDIEDLLRQEGITSVNGKKIKFGNKNRRSANAGYGVKNSHHKEIDQYTGYANARDISIVGGTDKDYTDFRDMLLGNDRIRQWFSQKGWGIINELTPTVMRKTNATGRHFHFGPDKWAVRTWRGWLDNPNIDVTKVF